MKKLITSYTFDASAKTITLSGYITIELERVLLITNVTDNVIIYNFAGIGKGGSVATNVLTLDYDTTTMDDADDLQIYYDDSSEPTTQYSEGDTASPATGTAIFGRYREIPISLSDGELSTPLLDPFGRMRVQPENSVLDVFQNAYTTDSGSLPGTPGGIMVLGSDGSAARYIKTASDGTISVGGSITANAGADLNTSALALESGGNLAALASKDFATQTTLAAINSKFVSGTDIGDVTINNASGASAVNVQDGGNSITVDGTITANAGTNLNTSLLALESGGNLATLAGVVKLEDAPSADGDPGMPILTVRRDTAATSAGTTGDYATLNTDNTGRVWVNVGAISSTSFTPGIGAANLGKAEDAAHASGDTGVMALGIRNDARATMTSADGDYSGVAVDGPGRQIIVVDTLTPGTSATALGKAEDAIHADGDVGVMMLAVRKDSATALAGTDGDYAPLEVDAAGRLHVVVQSVSPGTGASALGKAEDAAHTSGDVGVMDLGVRNDGAATSLAGSNGDYVPTGKDAQGRIYVVQKAPTATLSNVPSSATTVTILAANTGRVGAQVYNDSTQILYLKFGTAASSTSFTVKLAADTYYEVPAGYTGIIDGLWASANGSARVTEET